MDYEFRIQLLEKETAHLREMQQLSIQRQDTTDMRLDKLGEITHLLVESTTLLGSKIDALVTRMDSFLDTALRPPHNGH
jgi:hypothetical protein